MLKKDYSYLEGKEVAFRYTEYGKTINVKVVGCDIDLGITIQRTDCRGVDSYILCLNGPASPYARGGYKKSVLVKIAYQAVFKKVVKGIEEGAIVVSDFRYLLPANLNDPSVETCAFSQ